MKIANKSLGVKNTKTVQFYRGGERIELTVGPLPPKYLQRIEEAGISKYPEPPKTAVYLSPGRVLKENDRVVFETNYKDPAFRTAATKHLEVITAATLAAGLTHDTQFQLDVVKPSTSFSDSPQDWKSYFESVYSEMTDAETGFTDDEIEHLLAAVKDTSLCLDIEAATAVFSPNR